MRHSVHTAASAAIDVAGIAQWIEEEGTTEAADRWVADITDAIRSLEAFPGRCPLAVEARGGRGPAIRQLVRGRYRILFAVMDPVVLVLHVRHARQRAMRLRDLMDDLRHGLHE